MCKSIFSVYYISIFFVIYMYIFLISQFHISSSEPFHRSVSKMHCVERKYNYVMPFNIVAEASAYRDN